MLLKTGGRSVRELDRIRLIRRNCIDAGCDKDVTERVCALLMGGRTKDACTLLSGQRHALMDEVHQTQQKVDCLDYLIYSLQNRKN